MRIGIVGTGHVGLITGVALASLGHDIVGMDLSRERIAALNRGEAPFHEPDLPELLRQGMESGLLRFTTSVAEAVTRARVVFICVGRPPVGDGDRSLTAVEEAAREVARHAEGDVVLVVKSTVPPGTTGRIERVVRQERPELSFSAVSSPEFLREGHAVRDTLDPDRLVVGSDDPRGFEVVCSVYSALLDRGVMLFRTDPRTAELSKLASNAFLATKISFANALARVSELADADIDGVTAIMGADPRIGAAFLRAGLGFGGYCLPKDVVTLERTADRLGYDFAMLRETSRVNTESIEAVARMVEDAVWNVEGKTIALLGVAFKPGTDDIRGSPALALAGRLIAGGATVTGYDPMVSDVDESGLREVRMAADPYGAATGAHCVVVCTGSPEFLELDLERLKRVMAQPAIVDGCDVMDVGALDAAGFQVVAVGHPSTLT